MRDTISLRDLASFYGAANDTLGLAFVLRASRCAVDVRYGSVTLSCCTFRLAQVEMARILFRLASRQIVRDALELGFGTASILNVLRCAGATARGLEFGASDRRLRSCCQVELVYSQSPEDLKWPESPHQNDLIYALDVFKTRFGGCRTPLKLNGPLISYLERLRSLLASNGRMVLMNEHCEPACFTLDDCRRAGFDAVEWAAEVESSQLERDFFRCTHLEGRYLRYILKRP